MYHVTLHDFINSPRVGNSERKKGPGLVTGDAYFKCHIGRCTY